MTAATNCLPPAPDPEREDFWRLARAWLRDELDTPADLALLMARLRPGWSGQDILNLLLIVGTRHDDRRHWAS